jgi:hypothetical protein
MNTIPHIPALRRGRAYESLDKSEVKDHRTGQIKAVLSQVNGGIVRKDLQRLGDSRNALKKFSSAQLLEICARAGDQFLNGTLPLGDNTSKRCRARADCRTSWSAETWRRFIAH